MDKYVAFSGGKDSAALALILQDATPVFTDTGWEFDTIYHHIEKFEQVTGREVIRIRPDETLPQYIRRSKFLPNHGARYCTRMFKIEAYNRWLADKLPAMVCIGLRADEPEDLRVGNLSQIEGLTLRYLLRVLGMNVWDVIKVCVDHDLLPRNPPYMARGGCIGCFYKRKAEIRAMLTLVPDIYAELEALEKEVQDERGKFFIMFPNLGMSLSDFRLQPTLFDLEETYRVAADTSDKGIACGLFCHR